MLVASGGSLSSRIACSHRRFGTQPIPADGNNETAGAVTARRLQLFV
jgi:hypothetical protein